MILGCPHYSIEQLAKVAELLRGKRVHEEVTLRILTAPAIRYTARRMGIADVIEKAGGKIFAGYTGGEVLAGCWSWVPHHGVTVATDSAKCALFNFMGLYDRRNDVCFGTMEKCINAAITKKWSV